MALYSDNYFLVSIIDSYNKLHCFISPKTVPEMDLIWLLNGFTNPSVDYFPTLASKSGMIYLCITYAATSGVISHELA